MVAMFDGKYAEALSWTQRAVDIDPANPTPRMMHAMMLAANGQRDEGLALARRRGRGPISYGMGAVGAGPGLRPPR